jgi:hypothetical protein
VNISQEKEEDYAKVYPLVKSGFIEMERYDCVCEGILRKGIANEIERNIGIINDPGRSDVGL